MNKRIRKRDIFKYLTAPVSLAMLWFYIYYTEGWSRIAEVFKKLDYRFVVLMMLYPNPGEGMAVQLKKKNTKVLNLSNAAYTFIPGSVDDDSNWTPNE